MMPESRSRLVLAILVHSSFLKNGQTKFAARRRKPHAGRVCSPFQLHRSNFGANQGRKPGDLRSIKIVIIAVILHLNELGFFGFYMSVAPQQIKAFEFPVVRMANRAEQGGIRLHAG